MIKKPISFIFLSLWMLSAVSVTAIAEVTFNENQVEIALPPACNHVPISIPYIASAATFDEGLISVSSDSDWAIPSVNSELDRIDIAFATENLIASYTATISVDDGEKVTDLFVSANVRPLDIYRLLDDPLRSKTYGIQRDGIFNGSIVSFDPVQSSFISCITVGESPTDFVINDDSTELFVINSVGENIDVIDLETYSLKETINLPTYTAWGDLSDTTANIDLGPDDIIYYSDGSWGPVLHVLKRSTGEVLQSIIFDGSVPTNDTGFMDFAVTRDKSKLVAMPQYGWSAGGHSPNIGHFTINADGTVNFVKQTTLSNFSREPFEAPVLLSENDQVAVLKTISTDTADTDNLDRVFPSAIWSMNPSGSVVATGDKLYDYETGNVLYNIPGGNLFGSGYTYTKAQAFTSDFTRFVYFDSANRSLNVVNLVDEIGLDLLGRSLSPENGSVVNSPDSLTWAPMSGIDQYDVYLGTEESSVSGADPTSSLYLGRITGTSVALTETLINGTNYFWRIDPVSPLGPETGAVYTFTVSNISLDITEIDAQTVTGHADYKTDIQLDSNESGVTWSAAASDPWVTFTENMGSTPSTLSVRLDSTNLSPGYHSSSITITSADGEFQIPVQLKIDPLNVTHIRSDRDSEKVYAISEDSNNVISQAYLLEIDSAEEKIQRVTPVGSSVTDFTIHYADNLIYVTNWKSGNLLALDKSTLEHLETKAFQPAGATGYSEGDAYRVAAGASQRLVVEEQDQWVDISIYNTNTDSILDEAHVREGGGAFDPTGRYYYHGENNSSGASIFKFDTSGDSFTNLIEIRPAEISSYYGSRTVIVSEDGSRIFWAGVVLDQQLNTEWGIGEIVHSTSTDGRYAFCDTAIYDVNVRRQVLTMPTNTSVSGYNSTSEKLITQVGDTLKFYSVSSPISIPSPVLSTSNPTYDSVELSWTDESLEMEFVIQQRELNSGTWTDIKTMAANETNWTAGALESGTTYEFRIRASSPDHSSPWSNVATATLSERPNVQPVAEDDFVNFSSHTPEPFSIIDNDTDFDGQINPNSIAIVTPPEFGEILVHASGEVTYIPGDDFIQTDFFSYTVDDDDAEPSAPATVTVVFMPIPTLSVGNPTTDSIELNWTNDSLKMGYVVQQRELISSAWVDIQITEDNVTSWTATGLQEGLTYQFRVRASSSEYIPPWSNIASATVLQEDIEPTPDDNQAPIAADDFITLQDASGKTFSIIENDTDSDGEVNPDSIVIVIEPQFGQVIVNSGGEVSYIPDSNFTQTDSFSYTINDDDGVSSIPASVTLIYIPAPTLSISMLLQESIELSWTEGLTVDEFLVQQKVLDSDSWLNTETITGEATSLSVSALQAATTYEFRVRAQSGGYHSAWSNIAIATMPDEPTEEIPPKKRGGSFDLFSVVLVIIGLLLIRARSVPSSTGSGIRASRVSNCGNE